MASWDYFKYVYATYQPPGGPAGDSSTASSGSDYYLPVKQVDTNPALVFGLTAGVYGSVVLLGLLVTVLAL